MPHYIALIHKDPGSCYGVSFLDVSGVITAGNTLDEAMAQAREVLTFATEDWEEATGRPFPLPRSLDELRQEAEFTAQRLRTRYQSWSSGIGAQAAFWCRS